jgi:N-acetylmuramoyl-L-alanine amidase
MRWTRLGAVLAVAVSSLPIVISGAGEQQLTVYTAHTSYSLPVLVREGKAYVSVAALLAPLGGSPPRHKGKEWRFQLNQAEVRLTEGTGKASIRGQECDLDGKVRVDEQRILLPLAGVLPFLTRLLNTTVDFHQPSRRIFVGNPFTHFTAELKNGDPQVLVLNFSQPVAPDRAREEDHSGVLFTHTNRTTLTFKREPIIGDLNKQPFGDGAIQSLTFSEDNGTASLTITGNTQLNIVRSDDGKTITLQPAGPAAAASPTPEQPVPATSESQRHAPEFFVMIDPSHGGEDRGASFGGRLVEKDITLALGRELRKELEGRGIATRLLRESDVDVSLDRRADVTNEQHAGLYIALHAGRPGKGVRVYAPLLPNPQPAAGRFLPWESAQQAALDRSNAAAQAVSKELRKKGLTVASLGMPVRPLNNIVGPAIAVEVAPDPENVHSLESQKLQNTVAAAIASGIIQVRGQMGSRP